MQDPQTIHNVHATDGKLSGQSSTLGHSLHGLLQPASAARWRYQRRLCQSLALIASGVSIFYALCLWLLFGSYDGALFDFTFAGIHMLAFVLIQFRAYVYATYWTLLVTAIQITGGAVLFVGPETGFQYYLLCLPAVIYLLLREEPRHRKVLLMVLGTGMLFACEFLLIKTFRIAFTPLEEGLMYFSNLTLVLLLNYLAIKFFADEALEAYSEQKQLVLQDSLTQLANRRYVSLYGERLLALCRRYKHPLCVVLLDLDHFKLVNDRFGHAAGDAVLRHVAACLQEHVREPDIAARYGGEEFLILLPETSLLSAEDIAERIRARLESQPCMFENRAIPVQASFGICCSEQEQNADLDALLQHTDAALYRAKHAGRNCIVTHRALVDA